MDWIIIKDQKDIDILMRTFGNFHDSCLREMHLWTEHYVDEDLNMHTNIGQDIRLKVIFQRQTEDVSTIELLFEEVIKVNIFSQPEGYDAVIYGATLLREDNIFYWADEENWIPSKDDNNISFISARKLRWRKIEGLRGNKLLYGR